MPTFVCFSQEERCQRHHLFLPPLDPAFHVKDIFKVALSSRNSACPLPSGQIRKCPGPSSPGFFWAEWDERGKEAVGWGRERGGGMGGGEKQTSESAGGRGGFPLPAWLRGAEFSRSHKQCPQPSLSQCPMPATSWPQSLGEQAPHKGIVPCREKQGSCSYRDHVGS